jgi:hypothetical protein
VASAGLTGAQNIKFEVLAQGVAITPAASLALDGLGSLSPDDYASTSGVILQLEDDVWVNAPLQAYNSNFVTDTPLRLDFDGSFVIEGMGLASRARVCPQPLYHGTTSDVGELNAYVVTHADRARLSPVRGCAMTCTFCDIPYDFPLPMYKAKPVDALIAATRTALADPEQPAHHLLISGGTPKPKDVPWLRDLYDAVLAEFSHVQVDIMMAPVPGLFDLQRLADGGLHELSINLEIFGRDRLRELARQKFNQGPDFYLTFIEEAANALGAGRVRSMLMVGLEDMEDTLAGVRAIAERGGTPVLSPFRPDPATPLRDHPPPTASFMRECFERAREIVARHGAELGPSCPPCSHNTLGFAQDRSDAVSYAHPHPLMFGAEL